MRCYTIRTLSRRSSVVECAHGGPKDVAEPTGFKRALPLNLDLSRTLGNHVAIPLPIFTQYQDRLYSATVFGGS